MRHLIRNVVAGMICVLVFGSAGLASTEGFRRSVETERRFGRELLPGVVLLTGAELKPFQTTFEIPELADPYLSFNKEGILVTGTARYSLQFRNLDDFRKGGPYFIRWNQYFYSDGTAMEGGGNSAPCWDLKPKEWSRDHAAGWRIWKKGRDRRPPLTVWYGGHMRPRAERRVSSWPEDNYSRDIFAFIEKLPDQWFSERESVFSGRKDWPRTVGNYLGHRYGHQIVMLEKMEGNRLRRFPAIFYEEVTAVRPDGNPAITRIFMDEMISPFRVRGNPVELMSPFGIDGQPFPSAIREDGALLVEGPLYFRFEFEKEQWEALGFSAGSFYGKYISAFASRKVSDGWSGKPFVPDLSDNGLDLHDSGAELGKRMNLAGGPGRPAVLVDGEGRAVLDQRGGLQVLFHGYRREILPDHDYTRFPTKYRLDQLFRSAMLAQLRVSRNPRGALRFDLGPAPVR